MLKLNNIGSFFDLIKAVLSRLCFVWQQAAERMPLFQFTISRGPYIVVNVRFSVVLFV